MIFIRFTQREPKSAVELCDRTSHGEQLTSSPSSSIDRAIASIKKSVSPIARRLSHSYERHDDEQRGELTVDSPKYGSLFGSAKCYPFYMHIPLIPYISYTVSILNR